MSSPDAAMRRGRPKVAPMSEDALRTSEVRSIAFVSNSTKPGQLPLPRTAQVTAEPDSMLCSPADGGSTPIGISYSQHDVADDGDNVHSGYVFPQYSTDVDAIQPQDAAMKFFAATRAFAERNNESSLSFTGTTAEAPSVLVNNFFGARPERVLSHFPHAIDSDLLPTVLCHPEEECVGSFTLLATTLLDVTKATDADALNGRVSFWVSECVSKLPQVVSRLEGRGESDSVPLSINTVGKVRKNVQTLSDQRVASVRNGRLAGTNGSNSNLPLEAYLAAADAFLWMLRSGAIQLTAVNPEVAARHEMLMESIHASWPSAREQAVYGVHPSARLVKAASARFLSSETPAVQQATTTTIDMQKVDFATEMQSWCLLFDQHVNGQPAFTVTPGVHLINERPTAISLAVSVVIFGVVCAVVCAVMCAATGLAAIGYVSILALAIAGAGILVSQRQHDSRSRYETLRDELTIRIVNLALPTTLRTPIASNESASITAAPSRNLQSSTMGMRSDPLLGSSFEQLNPDQLRSGFLLTKRSQASMAPPGAAATNTFVSGTLNVSAMDDTRTSGVAQRRASATPNPLSQMVGVDNEGLVRVRMDATGTLLLPFMDDATNPIVLDGFHVHAHLCVIGVEFSKVYTSLEERAAEEVPDDRCFVCLWNHAIVSATGGFTDRAVLSNNLNDVLEDSTSVKAIAKRLAEIEAEVLSPTDGFSTEPIVLSFLHRDHGSVKMRVTVAPVTQTVMVPGIESCDVMVGAIIIGVPLDVRTSVASMTLRNRYLAEAVEQYYLEATSTELQPRNHRGAHRDFNERAFSLLLDSLRRVTSLAEASWKPVHSRCFTQELPLCVRNHADGATVACQVDRAVPDVVDLDLERVTASLASLIAIGRRGKLYSIYVSVPSTTSTLLMIRVIGIDTRKCAELLVGDSGDPLVPIIAGGMSCVMLTSVPSDELDPQTMVRQTSVVTGALSSVLSGLVSDGEFDCAYLFFPFRRSTGGEAGWLAQVANEPQVESPVLRRQTSMRVGASVSMSASMALNSSAEPMSIMVCADSEIARHKLSLALWTKSHSVIQVEDDDFVRSGQRILRSGNRRVDAVVVTRFQDLSLAFLKCCTDFVDVAFCVEITDEPSSLGAGGNPVAIRRKKSLQSGSEVLLNELNGSAGGRDQVVESLRKLPNVVFVTRAAHAPRFAADVVNAVTKMVGRRRAEIRKRDAIETLLRERRSMPWKKGKQLGRGTFGAVFEAEMTLTGGKMAVKVMHCGNNESKQQSLYNEIKVLLAVQHPNIVHYFHSERGSEGEVNIFMELCTGGNLAALIADKKNTIDVEEVASMTEQIVSALQYLHDTHNLAHRDLKPANVLLSNGKLKLADFGTAVQVKSQDDLHDMAGTMQYMAPEVFAGEPYGKPCDVWSVGVICLDLLRVVPACLDKYGLYCLGSAADDAQLWDGLIIVNDDANDFVHRCLRVRPADRSSAAELLSHPFVRDVRATFGLKGRPVAGGMTSATTVVATSGTSGAPVDKGGLSFSDSSEAVALIRDLKPADAFQEGANQWKSRFLASNVATPGAVKLAVKQAAFAQSPSASAKKNRGKPAAVSAPNMTSMASVLVPHHHHHHGEEVHESEVSIPVPVPHEDDDAPRPLVAESTQAMLPGQPLERDDLGPSATDAFAGVRNENLVMQDSVLSDF